MTTISHLPVQLLARILTRLDCAERLRSAAVVSSSWHAAAVMGTQDIDLCGVRSLSHLSAWLSAHGATAGVRSIKVQHQSGHAELQLPVLQLRSLEQLWLFRVSFTPATQDSSSTDGSQTSEPAPLVLSELPALTSLKLSYCEGAIAGLAECTGLQQLLLRPRDTLDHTTPAEQVESQLSAALPALRSLKTLELGGDVVSTDSVLQHVSTLSCLQTLVLEDSTCSALSLQQLPQSLTMLGLYWPEPDPAPGPAPVISPSTTPGICQLTALRVLRVQHVESFDIDVLASLTGLEELTLKQVSFGGPGSLSVLLKLQKIRHLQLPALGAGVLHGAPVIAAVTASSQLTLLDISDSFRSYSGQHLQLFEDGWLLPDLIELRVSLGFMCGTLPGKAAARCCSNLQRLRLVPDDSEDFGDEEDLEWLANRTAGMLDSWRDVQSLTSLHMQAQFSPMEPQVWHALGRHTQLQELQLQFMNVAYLPGMLHLSSCRQLTHLSVIATEVEMLDEVKITMTAHAGDNGSTALHEHLPQTLQDAVLAKMDHFGKHPRVVEGLFKVAVDAQRQQQQQIEGLRAQVAQVQQQAADMQAMLQQQQQETERLQAQVQVGAAQQVRLEQRLDEMQASLGWRES